MNWSARNSSAYLLLPFWAAAFRPWSIRNNSPKIERLKIRNNENLNNISLKNGTGAVKRPALSSNKTIDSNSNQRLKPTAATRASQPASRIEIPSTNQRLKLNRNSSTAASSTATNRSTVVKTTAKPTATLAPGTQLTAAPIDGVGGHAGAFHSNWNFFQPEAMSRWNFFFLLLLPPPFSSSPSSSSSSSFYYFSPAGSPVFPFRPPVAPKKIGPSRTSM